MSYCISCCFGSVFYTEDGRELNEFFNRKDNGLLQTFIILNFKSQEKARKGEKWGGKKKKEMEDSPQN